MAQIAADRRALIRLMEELGVRRDPVKQAVAWSFEKVGRLKPNGRLTGYSPSAAWSSSRAAPAARRAP